VEAPALVLGILGLLQRSIGPAIQIETRFAEGLAPVLTDANQLETALLNLAVNARDAMPDGGLIRIEAVNETVTQAAANGLPIGDYVRLVVRDTGCGMDAETLARATEPFYTTKGVGKGTGLGLSMVYGLVEQSGGRLVIHSRPGEGTAVELWLPRADPVGGYADVEAGPEPVDAADEDPLVILAVDDDALVLMNTQAMLEDLGHRVIPAMSGEEALAAARREPIDLIITDYAMPQMNGVQLVEAIRAERPGVRAVLATGYAELPDEEEVGITRLAKPFLQNDLRRTIGRAPGERAGDASR
jgi:CheY-like chemotaxis protein/anti-sigma regulatory factor (Ser/Thr protein kinase)